MLRTSFLVLSMLPLLVSAITSAETAALDAPTTAAPCADLAEDDVTDVSLLQLASVEWKKGEKLPKAVRDLKGETIKLVGYMALDTEEGQTTFRMSYESCSCSTSKVTHFVKVTLPKDEVTSFEPGTIEVVGTFYAGARYDDDGFVDSVYRVRAKSITAQ